MNVSSTAACSSRGFTTLSCKIELCTTAPQIAAVCSWKTGSRHQSGKTTIVKHLKGISKGKSSLPKSKKKSAPKAPFTRLTLPLQCGLRLLAAKRNSITRAATAKRNLEAAIPLRSADTALQKTKDWQHSTQEQIP